jgi:hypothetical protein
LATQVALAAQSESVAQTKGWQENPSQRVVAGHSASEMQSGVATQMPASWLQIVPGAQSTSLAQAAMVVQRLPTQVSPVAQSAPVVQSITASQIAEKRLQNSPVAQSASLPHEPVGAHR